MSYYTAMGNEQERSRTSSTQMQFWASLLLSLRIPCTLGGLQVFIYDGCDQPASIVSLTTFKGQTSAHKIQIKTPKPKTFPSNLFFFFKEDNLCYSFIEVCQQCSRAENTDFSFK